jgi:hypothetical protein
LGGTSRRGRPAAGRTCQRGRVRLVWAGRRSAPRRLLQVFRFRGQQKERDWKGNRLQVISPGSPPPHSLLLHAFCPRLSRQVALALCGGSCPPAPSQAAFVRVPPGLEPGAVVVALICVPRFIPVLLTHPPPHHPTAPPPLATDPADAPDRDRCSLLRPSLPPPPPPSPNPPPCPPSHAGAGKAAKFVNANPLGPMSVLPAPPAPPMA